MPSNHSLEVYPVSAFQLFPDFDVIVNCAGLNGGKVAGDGDDKNMFPIRGIIFEASIFVYLCVLIERKERMLCQFVALTLYIHSNNSFNISLAWSHSTLGYVVSNSPFQPFVSW